MTLKPLEERFWAKVNKTDTCWLWTGAKTPEGYGWFFVRYISPTKKVAKGAHQVSLELAGIQVPAGLQPDHLCKIKHCVRPDHMELVTPSVNSKRGHPAGYQKDMTKSDQIRALLAEGKSRAEVARLVGTSYQQVYQVDKKRGGSSGTGLPRSDRGSYGASYNRYGGSWGGFRAGELPHPEFAGKERHPIRTGPYQVTVAVQDGHEVRLTTDLAGKVCANCRQDIQFSALEAVYVHSGSGAPVTGKHRVQTGPGFFPSTIARKLPS